MMKKIKKALFDKTWKQCIWIFLIVFLIVCIGGFFSINYLHDVVTNNNIHSEVIVVADKVYGDNPYSDYYIVIDTKNKTYSIVDHGDSYGQNMFDDLEIGGKYKVIVKEPEVIDINHFTHILQVYDYNGTSNN